MDLCAHHVGDRLAHLRDALLRGHGPEASSAEVDQETRDRPALQLVPASIGRVGWGSSGRRDPTLSLVATTATPEGRHRRRFELDLRSAFVGAATAAIVSAVTSRVFQRTQHAILATRPHDLEGSRR